MEQTAESIEVRPRVFVRTFDGGTTEAPDIRAAEKFLAALDPEARTWCFQTFDDHPGRRDRRLIRVLHGDLGQHADALLEMNRLGAGVFVTINETDGRGRATENIIRVRAVFVDLDGAGLAPCLGFQPGPHIVVESSPGRWHVYWRVSDMPLADFGAVQRALIAGFDADPSVCDLPRVMRLPGFLHRKSQPLMVRIVLVNNDEPLPANAFAAIPEVGPTEAAGGYAAALGEVICSPGRHEALASLARTLSARGVCEEVIVACLRVVNLKQCQPPLAGERAAEVDDIARWAIAKPVVRPVGRRITADEVEAVIASLTK